MIYLDSSVALAYLLAEDRVPPETYGSSNWYQAVSSNTRYGTGFMLAGSSARMAMQCER